MFEVLLSRCKEIGIKLETLCKIATAQLDVVRILDLHDNDSSILFKVENGFRQWSLPAERKSPPHAHRRFFGYAERWMRFMGWLEEREATRHSHTREVTIFAARMSSDTDGRTPRSKDVAGRSIAFSTGWTGEAPI